LAQIGVLVDVIFDQFGQRLDLGGEPVNMVLNLRLNG